MMRGQDAGLGAPLGEFVVTREGDQNLVADPARIDDDLVRKHFLDDTFDKRDHDALPSTHEDRE